jgi:hypothetical protein
VCSHLPRPGNRGDNILINGRGTGNTVSGFTPSSLAPFVITSGFQAGVNTLDFVVTDVGSIAGLLVTDLRGTAESAQQPVPEPMSAIVWSGIGLLGFAMLRRRRK